ncbi:T9SS type A sorting domain-containing protein [Mariniphaga sp.]|uniref:T9SS type A sorting domain-containing protein n=1 Tax=Mariniphaga sp. TaxID=1954475 RepID=UPI003566B20B
MKTKFTTITMFALICLGIAAHGVEKNAEPGKIHLSDAKKALMERSENSGHLKTLFFTGNQLSVPRNSEDYSWDEDLNDWKHVSNTSYTYNNAGKLTEEIVRDAETNYYLTRDTYSDNPDYIFEEVSYTWIMDGWISVTGERASRTISAESPFEGYNNGILYQTLENEEWVFKTWIKYILNDYGIPTILEENHWERNNWIPYSRMGLLTWADWPNRKLAAYTKQNMQGYNWVNAERVSIQYNGENYTETTEIWENAEWVNSTRETYSLTSTEEELTLENWTAQGWENTEKYQGTFDNFGNPTGLKYSSWYDNDWKVDLALFMDLTYNESNDVTEMVIRQWDPSLTAPESLSKYVFSNFLHFTTDVPEMSVLGNVKVFPNPVSNNFNIQINENLTSDYQVNIVSLAGQTVFSNTYSDSNISINAGGLPSGMYLLNVKSDEGWTYTSKLLKK